MEGITDIYSPTFYIYGQSVLFMPEEESRVKIVRKGHKYELSVIMPDKASGFSIISHFYEKAQDFPV